MNMNNTTTLPRQLSKVEVMNAFMRSIYNWLAAGIGLTAVISFILTYTSARSLLMTPTGQMIGFGCIIAELVLVFVLSLRVQKLSAQTATGLFLGYSLLNGISLSFVLMMYTPGSVAQAFIGAAGMFAVMSIYGLYTKKDLTSWGSLLFMGLIGIIIAMVVNIFLGSNALTMAISVIGIIIFLGLTAYDTQLFREMGESIPHDDATAVRRGAIIGALNLYLNFINIFLMLLRLMGNRE